MIANQIVQIDFGEIKDDFDVNDGTVYFKQTQQDEQTKQTLQDRLKLLQVNTQSSNITSEKQENHDTQQKDYWTVEDQQVDEDQSLLSEDTDRNQTKNRCKGVMKAFAGWIIKNKNFLQSYAKDKNLDIEDYVEKFAKQVRKSANVSIVKFRQILTTNKFANHNRVLLNYFLRMRFINHIFNSKMKDCLKHLKYIPRWKKGVINPQKFDRIK